METKKGNGKNVIFIAMAAVCLCIIVVLAGICLNLYRNGRQTAPAPDNYAPSGSSIVVSEDSRNTVANIEEKVKKGMIEVKMTPGWVFEDGGKSSNAYLANSERNSYDLRFEISLADTGEVIMTSPDVPIGSCIENFPLSVTLDPGEYSVVVAHQQVEDGEVINTVRTASTITVK